DYYCQVWDSSSDYHDLF
nr:immunoglobulin light chain junction region [Macaca mulatta]MOX41622.1 immunoglobulin light chain junction region [Macaca mulatta]MOX41732.1 immunoglobulin light chain junction region [Macaca mulatta]MOX41844.1 immunoglobulin light chain junction region [Macaca mulatta]MOX41853.1 immunoglobulin light chain junction region [Macaca mulatta]